MDIGEIEARIVRFRNGGSLGPEPRTLDECEWLIGEVRQVQKRLDLAERELARFRARERSRLRTVERESAREPVGDGEPHLITRGVAPIDQGTWGTRRHP